MRAKALLLLAAAVGRAFGHPGGIRDGRASCGREFDSPDSAFVIVDITEAWYLRRASTCESPFFWASFRVETDEQRVYIATISPEISRFEDRLNFNAVLFGPGLPQLNATTLESLPAGLEIPQGLGARVLESPESLAECGFVDENSVMRRFSDPIDGRCMEDFEYDADYKDPMVAGGQFLSWWLYSKNHNMADAGDYYLVSWLTERGAADATTPVTGKYEMTLGPWTWSGYADDATTNLTQSQVTTCTCSGNKIAYTEQNADRVGGGADAQSGIAPMLADVLPFQVCSPDVTPATSCVASAKKAPMSADSAVEFAGNWTLRPGAAYEWTFRAYHPEFEYPDASMDIFIKACTTLEEFEAEADAAMMASASAVSVEHGGAIALDAAEKQTLVFRAEPTTSFTFQAAAAGPYCFFTQHRPEEFLAMYVKCTSEGEICRGAEHAFSHRSALYGDWSDAATPTEEDVADAMGHDYAHANELDHNHDQETPADEGGDDHDHGPDSGHNHDNDTSDGVNVISTAGLAKVVRPTGFIVLIVHGVLYALASK